MPGLWLAEFSLANRTTDARNTTAVYNWMYISPRFQAVIICFIFISEASAQIYTAEHISKEHIMPL